MGALGRAAVRGEPVLDDGLQVAGFNIPTDVIQMLPFAMVILVLILFARHSQLPPALGIPYHRGER